MQFQYILSGLSESAIAAFRYSYNELVSGTAGSIAEASIAPVQSLPILEDLRRSTTRDPSLLKETVVLKLNGGLGTSMGLDKAKSLLLVKGQNTFLDLTAKQVCIYSASAYSIIDRYRTIRMSVYYAIS